MNPINLTASDIERFHAKYFKDNSGCWLWTASYNRGGYGKLQVQRKTLAAHRVSWTITNGPIPKGKVIRHMCDVPRCVNPDHLETGSQRDNYYDMERLGTLPCGVKSGSNKLTEEQVLQIREMPGFHREIAVKFNINPTTVDKIKLRLTWAHLPEQTES